MEKRVTLHAAAMEERVVLQAVMVQERVVLPAVAPRGPGTASAFARSAAPDRMGAKAMSARGGEPAAGRVLVAPWGEVVSTNGRFVVDAEAGRLVVEAFRRHGTDVPVDYEHQSLGGTYASPTGQAPAAGWIRAVRVVTPGGDEEPGLYAEVEWTEGARARLAAREYRYLSPVVMVRKSDRRVVALHSAALTNKPAIVGMRPIVNREAKMEERLLTTTEEADGGQPAIERLKMRLGLEPENGAEAVIVAARERIETLEEEARQRDARERVDAAMRAGKLTGGQEAWAMGLAMKDPAGFDEWVGTAPVVVVPGRTEPPAGGERTGRGRAAVLASAKATYRREPGLMLLTSEEAWVEEALREAGVV